MSDNHIGKFLVVVEYCDQERRAQCRWLAMSEQFWCASYDYGRYEGFDDAFIELSIVIGEECIAAQIPKAGVQTVAFWNESGVRHGIWLDSIQMGFYKQKGLVKSPAHMTMIESMGQVYSSHAVVSDMTLNADTQSLRRGWIGQEVRASELVLPAKAVKLTEDLRVLLDELDGVALEATIGQALEHQVRKGLEKYLVCRDARADFATVFIPAANSVDCVADHQQLVMFPCSSLGQRARDVFRGVDEMWFVAPEAVPLIKWRHQHGLTQEPQPLGVKDGTLRLLPTILAPKHFRSVQLHYAATDFTVEEDRAVASFGVVEELASPARAFGPLVTLHTLLGTTHGATIKLHLILDLLHLLGIADVVRQRPCALIGSSRGDHAAGLRSFMRTILPNFAVLLFGKVQVARQAGEVPSIFVQHCFTDDSESRRNFLLDVVDTGGKGGKGPVSLMVPGSSTELEAGIGLTCNKELWRQHCGRQGRRALRATFDSTGEVDEFTEVGYDFDDFGFTLLESEAVAARQCKAVERVSRRLIQMGSPGDWPAAADAMAAVTAAVTAAASDEIGLQSLSIADEPKARGACKFCGKTVFSDQPRSSDESAEYDEYGNYFDKMKVYWHLQCTPVPAAAPKAPLRASPEGARVADAQPAGAIVRVVQGEGGSPGQPQSASAEVGARGRCKWCMDTVFTSQPRSRDERGAYFHLACSPQQP